MYGCKCGRGIINHTGLCPTCNAELSAQVNYGLLIGFLQFIGLLWIVAITALVYQLLFTCFGSIDGAYQCTSTIGNAGQNTMWFLGQIQWTLVLGSIWQSICEHVPNALQWLWETAKVVPWIEVLRYTYMAIYATGYLMFTIGAVCVKGVLVVLGIVAN